MAIDDVRQLARGWLLDLANCIWPEEQVERLQRDADLIKEEIRQGYQDLLRGRRVMEELHAAMTEQEQQTVTLPWQVDAYLQVGNRKAAYRSALQLEEIRAALSANRRRWTKLKREYEAHVARLEEERALLGRMQVQVRRLRQGNFAPAAPG
jgi:hypothetical protein